MQDRQQYAAQLIADFAERTGLSSDAPVQRYLWTDAFAVCTLLELHACTAEDRYRIQCEQLIDQVHNVLGRHRPDDPRSGWLSGLGEEEGAAHPTSGGLRIGKPLPERGLHEPFNEHLEWERDGQYFHYLTKWMDALIRAAILLDRSIYLRHAVELAKSVFPRFALRIATGEIAALAWKMSIDLSRQQTAGSSLHDCLDGYVTFQTLRWASDTDLELSLDQEIETLRQMCSRGNWATDDPLGLGGLLLDSLRLLFTSLESANDARLLAETLSGISVGLRNFARLPFATVPAAQRLAFRELGLSIGLQAIEMMRAQAKGWPRLGGGVDSNLQQLSQLSGLGAQIVDYWAAADARNNETWRDHRDINEVMLAAALIESQPNTFLRMFRSVSAADPNA